MRRRRLKRRFRRGSEKAKDILQIIWGLVFDAITGEKDPPPADGNFLPRFAHAVSGRKNDHTKGKNTKETRRAKFACSQD